MSNSNGNSIPVAGFLSPPAWTDPSPAEFHSICADTVIVQQAIMQVYKFSFQLSEIAGTLPEMLMAARALGEAGCDVIAHTGTPFGWAGLPNEHAARHRQQLLSDAAGVPVVMAGTAILDGLRALGVERAAIATPYYNEDWRNGWRAIVESSGIELLLMQSMDQQGLVPADGQVEDHGWAMNPDLIVKSATKLVREADGAQAVVITGAGARTLMLTAEIEKLTGLPVLASDTALYWSLARSMGISLAPGALGALTDLELST